MRWRGKRIAVTAALLLALSCLLWLPASAADVYFTAVNNTCLKLEDENMPVSVNGTMYVPYTVFNSKELGTYAIYSYSSQTVVILRDRQELYYDMSRGMTYDQDDTELSFKAVFRKGKVYVPVGATCQFFGLTYSYITSSDIGDIVRITTGDAMDDDSFVSSATWIMQSYLNSYLKSATPTATQPVVTTTPVPTSSAPVYGEVEVYTAFIGLNSLAEKVMDKFEQRGYRTCFFLTAEDIVRSPDLVREICGRGHSVGLLLGEAFERDYARAAALLFEAAAYRTQLVVLDGEVNAEIASLAEELGLNLWCDINTARIGADELQDTRRNLADLEGRADLIFILDDELVDGLDGILLDLRAGRYNVRQLRETIRGHLDLEGNDI